LNKEFKKKKSAWAVRSGSCERKTAERLDFSNGGKSHDIRRENMIRDAQMYELQLPQ